MHEASANPLLSAAGSGNRQRTAHPTKVLIASMVASSIAFLDGSIVNVALPALASSLHGTPAQLQWTINGYLLPLSALLLLGGAAGDAFGRRRLLLLGILVFGLGSLGCVVARSFAMLIPMRAMQGLGAAILMPNSLGSLSAAFSGSKRGRAIGTWAAAGVGASAAGPPLGGWLIATFGWPSIFLMNIPLTLLAGVLVWRWSPTTKRSGARLDWTGAVLATLALALFTWALTLWTSHHRMPPIRWAEMASAAVALAAFLAVEHRKREHAMMPLGMFGSVSFLGLTAVTFLTYAALGGLFVLLPYVLIEGGYAPLQAGLALLPFPVIVGAGSRLTGLISGRTGARLPITIGAAVSAAGYALLMRVDPAARYWTSVVPGAAVLSIGMAGVVAPLTTAVLASVDERYTGTASGFNSATGRTGGLIATALSGAVLAETGPALLLGLHQAALVGAGMLALAALVAFATIERDQTGEDEACAESRANMRCQQH